MDDHDDDILGEPSADYSDLEPVVLPVSRTQRAARPPRSSTRLSVPEAAEVLGVSRKTLDRAIAAMPEHRRPTRLPGRGTGARVRYSWASEAELVKWWDVVTTITTTTGTVVRMESPPRPRKRKAVPALDDDQPVDWDAVIRRR